MSAEPTFTLALAGNPNVGKSTIFNALTNLRQHTGNWAGKTVACASGVFSYRGAQCLVVDLPGIYSLRTHSEEEEIAREYLCSEQADLLLVVCDATCLERGLHLLKQIVTLEDTALPSMILCVNLCDEAAKKGIVLDFKLLSERLNIPVIPCAARNKTGLDELKDEIYTAYLSNREAAEKRRERESGRSNPAASDSPASSSPAGSSSSAVPLLPKHKRHNFPENIPLTAEETETGFLCHGCAGCPFCCGSAVRPMDADDGEEENNPEYRAERRPDDSQKKRPAIPDFSPKELAAQAVSYTNPSYRRREERLDRLLTGRFTGSLIMILMLLGIFWLTITGANYPSEFLWNCFYRIETWLAAVLTSAGVPAWFISASVYGVFRVVAWIVSVMLPPMAIFFPLFTLLEDLGYLPRVAFNMDCAFKRCKACGKQCLTMCMVNN